MSITDLYPFVPMLPLIILFISGFVILMINLLGRKTERFGYIAAGAMVFALAVTAVIMLFRDDIVTEYLGGSAIVFGMYEVNHFNLLFQMIFLTVGTLVAISAVRTVREEPNRAEFFFLLLMAVTGMLVVSAANNLAFLYVGLEMASISSYALVAFRKSSATGAEAATKYFLIGALSSSLILFGISFIYGATGTLDLSAINAVLATGRGFEYLTVAGISLMIAGFGFKIAAVPFHMWAPDVYEGAPISVTAFLAGGSKKLGFVILFKVFLMGLFAVKAQWDLAIGVLAILTMTVGNLMALRQKSMKRLLAYSSVAQAGYMLIVLPVGTQFALCAGILYIIVHLFMKAGAFLVVAAMEDGGQKDRITSYKGLMKRAPFLGFVLTIFLLSLGGIPPLAGFWAKFFVFSSAVQGSLILGGSGWLWWLALAGVLNSAMSLFYYARVVKFMWTDEPRTDSLITTSKALAFPIVVCLVFVILIGLFPGFFMDVITRIVSGEFTFLP